MKFSTTCITAVIMTPIFAAPSASATPSAVSSSAPSFDPTFTITFDSSITDVPSEFPSYQRTASPSPLTFRERPDPFYTYRREGGYDALRTVIKYIIYCAASIPLLEYFDSLDLSNLRQDAEEYVQLSGLLEEELWVDDDCSRRVMDNEPQTRDMNIPMEFVDDMEYEAERKIFYSEADYIEDDVPTEEIIFGIEGDFSATISFNPSDLDCDDLHIGTFVTIDLV